MLPIHVINLARRPDRLVRIGAELDGLGLPWQRVEAIDSAESDPATLARAFGAGPLARMFPATLGDMACSLTHQCLWGEIAGGEAEAAIVLEDDARLAAGFAALAACDLAGLMERNGMGALKLEFWPGPQRSRRFPLGEALGPVESGTGLFRMRSSFLGTCGYVVTREAAERLLTRYPRLGVPVDHFLFGAEAGRGYRLLRPGFLNPAPVLHDVETFGSDIGAEREAGMNGPRGWRRRLRDHRHRKRQEAELGRGKSVRVEMHFAG
ncbi:glycosyltransferase family 25 protein [Defluviimonas sp. WL0024]|uniref:Glycosyltransferase family 25 protein n=2 Tax=Albidovulum TaxID=205889 RepID=A0ABT3IZT5_9RHOB|nr:MULTISPECIES: glycosyltransferase family 25 protein [Defluviimonas]MCU9847106.1 glycosyltransferase family 25 protein [Defluviimonas sp. WL0024]MCW3780906.1 glycosyltransferase family 25 protein [Defluviimonas salinarum]